MTTQQDMKKTVDYMRNKIIRESQNKKENFIEMAKNISEQIKAKNSLQALIDSGFSKEQINAIFHFVTDMFSDFEDILKTVKKLNRNIFYKPIKDLEISKRSINCLSSENIKYVGQLVKMKEADLLKIPNLGHLSLQEIKDALRAIELNLGIK